MARKRKQSDSADFEGNMHLRDRRRKVYEYKMNMDDFLPDDIFDSEFGMSLIFGGEYENKVTSPTIKPVKKQTKKTVKTTEKNVKKDHKKKDEVFNEPETKKIKIDQKSAKSDAKDSKVKAIVKNKGSKSKKAALKKLNDEEVKADKEQILKHVKLDTNDIKSLIYGINVMEEDIKLSKNKSNSLKDEKGKNNNNTKKNEVSETKPKEKTKSTNNKNKVKSEEENNENSKKNKSKKVNNKEKTKTDTPKNKTPRKIEDKTKSKEVSDKSDENKSTSKKEIAGTPKTNLNKGKVAISKKNLDKDETNKVKDEKEKKGKAKKAKGSSKAKDADEVLITGESPGSQERSKYRTKLSFTKYMEKEILGEKMLSDMTINYSLLLLHKQFPSIKGLEDTELGPRGLFTEQNGHFMQILFADTHWLLACVNALTPRDQVLIFNSKSDDTLSNDFIKQIFLMRKRNKKQRELNLLVQSVQQQRNDIDCGPLSLCYTVDLLLKTNPVGRYYDLQMLRKHLFKCLKNGNFTAFPTVGTSRKTRLNVCEESKINVKINCFCKEKACCYERDVTADGVILCSKCQGIFFRTCGDIPGEYLHKDMMYLWSCKKCASEAQKNSRPRR